MLIAAIFSHCYPLPMGVTGIRKRNLDILIGKMAGGNQAQFASDYTLNASHISQIMGGHRGMGHAFARKLEHKLSLPDGAMDVPMAHPDNSPLSGDEDERLKAQLMAFWADLTPAVKRELHGRAKVAHEQRVRDMELEAQRARVKHTSTDQAPSLK